MIYLKKNYIPLFSVVLTTYNRETLFKRAVNSLTKQTEKDWECLIIDDGSDDKTYEHALKICKSDDRFRYVFTKNLGQVAAKNIGIKNATGEYVTFLDSDDEYEEKHLETRKIMLNENPEIDFLHGGFKIIGDEYVPDINNQNNNISLHDCVIGGTFFIRRKQLLKLNGLEVSDYGEDTELFIKAKNNKLKIAKTTEDTYIYHRDHEDSITKQ